MAVDLHRYMDDATIATWRESLDEMRREVLHAMGRDDKIRRADLDRLRGLSGRVMLLFNDGALETE